MTAMYVGGSPTRERPVIGSLARPLLPTSSAMRRMPYLEFQAILDPEAPPGQRNYWRSEYLSALTDDAIDTYIWIKSVRQAKLSPFSQTIIFRLGGVQSTGVGEDEKTAFVHRDAALHRPPDHRLGGPVPGSRADRRQPGLLRGDATVRNRSGLCELDS